jgi:hypothetical protein
MSIMTDAMQLQLPTINRNEIIAYNNVPVVTTRMLADFYGVSAQQIRQNYNNHKERFIEEKHLYRLADETRKTFREGVDNIDAKKGMRGDILLLWTQRGAARHAKMINTDQAWEVFEVLEDTYFKQYAKDFYREASRRAREAKAEWQRTRVYGKEEARKPLMDVIRGFYLMYQRQKDGQKCQAEGLFHTNFTKVTYFYAFDNGGYGVKIPKKGFRDMLTQPELKHVAEVETKLRAVVVKHIGMDTPYKEADKLIKAEMDEYVETHGRITCHALPLMLGEEPPALRGRSLAEDS